MPDNRVHSDALRAADLNDLPTLKRIARSAIDKGHRRHLADSVVDWWLYGGTLERGLGAHLPQTTVYVRDGEVVGYIACVGTRIQDLAVDPDHQGQGIGTSLVEAAETAVRQDIGMGLMEAGTFASNAAAFRLGEKLGWTEAGRAMCPPLGDDWVHFMRPVVPSQLSLDPASDTAEPPRRTIS